jgi:hypothetical protein
MEQTASANQQPNDLSSMLEPYMDNAENPMPFDELSIELALPFVERQVVKLKEWERNIATHYCFIPLIDQESEQPQIIDLNWKKMKAGSVKMKFSQNIRKFGQLLQSDLEGPQGPEEDD